jgi:hypothetical protein
LIDDRDGGGGDLGTPERLFWEPSSFAPATATLGQVSLGGEALTQAYLQCTLLYGTVGLAVIRSALTTHHIICIPTQHSSDLRERRGW